MRNICPKCGFPMNEWEEICEYCSILEAEKDDHPDLIADRQYNGFTEDDYY